MDLQYGLKGYSVMMPILLKINPLMVRGLITERLFVIFAGKEQRAADQY